MTWYAKLDSGFHSNRKARQAGRLGREVFVFVLCMNAHRSSDGFIPAADLEPWFVADQLQMTESEASEGIQRAINAGLIRIDGEAVIVCGWDEAWSRMPASGAQRQARYRESKKNKVLTTSSDTASDVTPVTSDERAVTRDARSDGVTQEGRKEGRNIDPPSRKRGRVKKPKTTRPEAWEPTDSHRAFCEKNNLDLEAIRKKFIHGTDAKGTLYADWDAGFFTWLHNALEWGQNKKQPQLKLKASNSLPDSPPSVYE